MALVLFSRTLTIEFAEFAATPEAEAPILILLISSIEEAVTYIVEAFLISVFVKNELILFLNTLVIALTDVESPTPVALTAVVLLEM